MTDSDRVSRFLRHIGRQFEEARTEFGRARTEALADLPTDGDGNVRLVCRRHAEKRAVALDRAGRPACFEEGHPDCEGCVEDIRADRIETWTEKS